MPCRCNEETFKFLEELNNYFRQMNNSFNYQFTALPLSSKRDDVDDKIELNFHRYIDINAKFKTKLEEDLDKLKELLSNSDYGYAVYIATVYGDSHRHFSFTIPNPYANPKE